MLDKLPNELLLLIVQLTLPPHDTLSPKAAGRRQALLTSLSRVNKRLCRLAKPLLLQSILVGTPRQAKLVARLPKKLREQVETVVFRMSTTPLDGIDPYDEDDVPDLLVGTEALEALVALPKVKHARFYDFCDFETEHMTWQTHLDFDLSAKSPFLNLDTLLLSECKICFTGRGPAPPFALTQLAFVGRTILMDAGVDKLFRCEVMPNLETLRCGDFNVGYYGGSAAGSGLPDIPTEILAQVQASHKPPQASAFPAPCVEANPILVDSGLWGSRQDFDGTASRARYIRLTSVHAGRWSSAAAIVPSLQSLSAAFMHRDLHPDKVEPKNRDMALALLNVVKQTRAEIVWTGSDDHALILPEFARYINERQ